MKIFLSWSGEVSHQVALAWKDWLPSVLQVVEPYVSSDIDKGSRWATEIAQELEQSNFGLLCVTPDNMESTWLNFEAGALSKSIEKGKVAPFLVGLEKAELQPGPLLQFQATDCTRDDVFKLLQSMNETCDDVKLSDTVLDRSFSRAWSEFEEQIAQIAKGINSSESPATPRTVDSMVREILETLRSQQLIIAEPTKLFPPEYFASVAELISRESRTGSSASKQALNRFFDRYDHLTHELLERGDEIPKELLAEFLQTGNAFLELREAMRPSRVRAIHPRLQTEMKTDN
jgi:hypothetical protein